MAKIIKNKEKILNYLTTIYNKPGNAGSFGGVENLYRAVKEDGLYKVTRKEIKDFLNKRDEYVLHRPVFHKFPTNHVIVGGINDLHQGDLIDMGKNSAKYNDGVTFLLSIIDCFSKYGFVVPLKNKSGNEVLRGLVKVYENRDTPNTFTTDGGKEFTNKLVQNWFKRNNVNFNIAKGLHKSQYVERFNRTIKGYLSRYMTLNNTYRYIDVLEQIVAGYNKRYHRATGYKPIDVNYKNAKSIFKRMYGTPNKWFSSLKKPKFRLGEYVRISRYKGMFEKGYEENYTREIFQIDTVYNTDPRQYKLKSLKGEKIQGRFYEKEMIRAELNNNDMHQIEKIIKERVNNGVNEVYVKWKGWDKSHNQWVKKTDVEDI